MWSIKIRQSCIIFESLLYALRHFHSTVYSNINMDLIWSYYFTRLVSVLLFFFFLLCCCQIVVVVVVCLAVVVCCYPWDGVLIRFMSYKWVIQCVNRIPFLHLYLVSISGFHCIWTPFILIIVIVSQKWVSVSLS